MIIDGINLLIMIARKWHGMVPKAKKEAYFDYLKRTGLHDYGAVKGNLGLQVLQKDESDITHFHLITFWESVEAIKRFAGEQYEKARYYPEDGDFLLEFEPLVEHFEVLNTFDNNSGFNLADYFRTSSNHQLGNASWTK